MIRKLMLFFFEVKEREGLEWPRGYLVTAGGQHTSKLSPNRNKGQNW